MKFFVYILYSEKCDRYYIGYSEDPFKRLNEKHNVGRVKATKYCFPYILKATKQFDTELDAIREERRIKLKKSRDYIVSLINGNW